MGQQHLFRLCTAVGAILGIANAIHAAVGQITPIIIGESTFAYDINDNGTVVGWTGPYNAHTYDTRVWQGNISHPDSGSAFRYETSGPNPGVRWANFGNGSIAYAVNNAGTVVGDFPDDSGWSRSFVIAQGQTTPTLLDSQGAASRAYGVSESGVIIGSTGGYDAQPYRHTGTGPIASTDYATGWRGSPYAINASGTVAGSGRWSSGAGTQAAVISNDWNTVRMMDLGGFGGAAFGISNDGVAVGTAKRVDGTWRLSAVRMQGDRLERLGSLADLDSVAYSIGPTGLILGWDSLWPGDQRAVVWSDQPQGIIDLNQFLAATNPAAAQQWFLLEARDINSSGMIVGTGLHVSGADGLPFGQYAFVLDASTLVPEPTILLTLAASTPLLLLRRRKRTT